MPSPRRSLGAQLRTVNFQGFRSRSAKRLAAAALAMQMLFLPSPVSAVVLSDAIRDSGAAATGMQDTLLSWLKLSPPQEPDARGVKSPPPEQMSDKMGRLARLEINPKGTVQLESRESMLFAAVPFDSEGSAIHGLQAEWESSDKQVVFIKRDGEARAGKPGYATVTARAGSLTARIQVIVMKGDGEPFGKQKPDSNRNPLRIRQHPAGSENDAVNGFASRGKKRHHPATSRYMFLRDPNDDPLPDNETTWLYKPINTVGSPPGKKGEAGPMYPHQSSAPPKQTVTRTSLLQFPLRACRAEASAQGSHWFTTVRSGTSRPLCPPRG